MSYYYHCWGHAAWMEGYAARMGGYATRRDGRAKPLDCGGYGCADGGCACIPSVSIFMLNSLAAAVLDVLLPVARTQLHDVVPGEGPAG